MTYKKFRKLRLELARQIWLMHNGNLKGFGKTSKAVRDAKVDWAALQALEGYEHINSYDAIWESKPFKSIRDMVGM